MEEVDGIIIHILRSIGCDVQENVQSLRQFPTELVVEGIALCLKTLNNDLDVPTKLPPSMTARFKVGTTLAQAVQSLGYKGEVGYQTFLYSSESEVRKVFLFLVQLLQKQQSVTVREELPDSAILFKRNLAAEVKRQLYTPWLPPHGKLLLPKSHSFQATALSRFSARKQSKASATTHMSFMTSQPRCHADVLASLVELAALERIEQQEEEAARTQTLTRGARGQKQQTERRGVPKAVLEALQQCVKDEASLGPTNGLKTVVAAAASPNKTKASRFKQMETLQFKKDDSTLLNVSASLTRTTTSEDEDLKRQQQLSELEAELGDCTSRTEMLVSEMRRLTSAISQATERAEQTASGNKEKESQYVVQKQTCDLLPNAEENIAKLQEMVDIGTKRLAKLAQQWEKHRQPLADEIRELEESANAGLGSAEERMAKIADMRDKTLQCAAQTKQKEEIVKQLQEELQNLTKDINRTAYTRRILEILANIHKQKDGINKIIGDTKALQKDINMLTGKLDRTFTVTDELIFQDVKKDEMSRKAYKLLAALHENCTLVIATVEETGVIFREIRDLEEQIDQANSTSAQQNLDKITADLTQIKQENAELIRQVKKKPVS